MSERIEVKREEIGVVRVFAVDLDGDRAKEFAENPKALTRALGARNLNPDYAEVFPLSNLEGMGLKAFLEGGHAIPTEALAEDAEKLEALEGYVAVVTSRAFGGKIASLDVTAPLRLVGTYHEDRPEVAFTPLPDKTARFTHEQVEVPVAPPPPPVRGGRLGFIISILVILLGLAGFALLIQEL